MIGVGTSSPSALLTVSSGEARLDLNATNASGRLWNLYSGGGGNVGSGSFAIAEGGATQRLVIVGGGSGEALRIDASNRVGIGTSSVSSKLHVQDAHTLAADSQIALIENTTTGEPASLAFLAKADNAGGGNKGAIYFDAGAGGGTADNKLQFTAQHQDTITPAMTLDGSGRLGIGTTSPAQVLLELGAKQRQLLEGECFWDRNLYAITVALAFQRLPIAY
jgi:hypothetical protein